MSMSETVAPPPLSYISVQDSAPGYRLAYRQIKGDTPGMIWLGGFRSDMDGTKAQALETFAKAQGHACLRFDYRGHGLSDGRFEEGTISAWLDDAKTMLHRVAEGGQILVGSSMGGWIALLLALAEKQKATLDKPSPIRGLVLLAPAPDFTEKLMWQGFSEDIRRTILDEGVYPLPSAYDDQPTPITRALIDDGRTHQILDGIPDLGCPVHIVQGVQDPDVPVEHVLKLKNALVQDNVQLTLIKDGDHRLSRPQDLELLNSVYKQMLDRLTDPAQL
jgi:pimeloyl-ACP methyl ester carboxylesterase